MILHQLVDKIDPLIDRFFTSMRIAFYLSQIQIKIKHHENETDFSWNNVNRIIQRMSKRIILGWRC